MRLVAPVSPVSPGIVLHPVMEIPEPVATAGPELSERGSVHGWSVSAMRDCGFAAYLRRQRAGKGHLR